MIHQRDAVHHTVIPIASTDAVKRTILDRQVGLATLELFVMQFSSEEIVAAYRRRIKILEEGVVEMRETEEGLRG